MGTPVTGLDRIDLDHQDLFRQLAELRAALRAGVRSEVKQTLAYVRSYVDSHFALEEREMLASGDPLFPVHRAAHARLAREVRVLEAEWSRSDISPALADSVLEALSDWFEVHNKELDAQLARHLKASTRPERALGWPTQVPAARVARR